jgi:hypothetical protein
MDEGWFLNPGGFMRIQEAGGNSTRVREPLSGALLPLEGGERWGDWKSACRPVHAGWPDV